jgi:alpha-D-xyloside xylohydrolase
MGHFSQEGQILIWRENQETVWLQPWGRDGLRVQANLAGKCQELPQALLEKATGADDRTGLAIGEQEASIRNGLLLATVSREGRIRFTRTDNGNVLLEELATAHAGARR